ncbi:3-oxo-5-alpha-steroid 4-dehydrogenase family protein [Aspergillus clavatus NRRL 1]|uniref:3-oxo-5-alpha-steroid 4-dehydrogenase C-terminal domain-containing protein n=1 Tax=Aspergillus clavatus (strain ATCC 1007 / CBS 513.65 / DSM 816 / NCTC 3887 / NRRL 1 / QM 1276 / 107) TaxID=344612 RepID=A1CH46_ASPCL|nr:uncharacterized protein ACLA_046670 [Aspergillus clavatus NRRL 1]EAW10201.1 conserved hypothetical protein [Aspergillus clavatus NRRL 1]
MPKAKNIMGTAFSSSWGSLPPFREFILPTPQTYTTLVNIFQYFPVFTLVQWIISWHPAGKGSYQSSWLNVPGKLGWFIMEIIGPVNLLYTLWKLPPLLNLASLPPANKLVAALYVIHYINRAIVSPLFAAPSMSPMHLSVVLMAVLFNWFNSACLAGWLVGYHIPVLGYTTDGAAAAAGPSSSTDNPLLLLPSATPYSPATHFLSSLGMVLFAAGMIGNIYSERTLFRLRREAAQKRDEQQPAPSNSNAQASSLPPKDNSSSSSSSKNKFSKVYVIPPPTGVFRSILYPHYVFEWLEWLGFALVGTAVFPGSTGHASAYALQAESGSGSGPLRLAPWLVPAAWLADQLRVPLPLPAVVFVVNAVANMLPHARWGRRWYVERFGEGAVAGRGAAVPWCSWL